MAKISKFILEYREVIKNIDIDLNNFTPPKHTMKRFVHLLKELSDVRVKGMIDYSLEEILVIVFLAVLVNASSWSEITAFGIAKEKPITGLCHSNKLSVVP